MDDLSTCVETIRDTDVFCAYNANVDAIVEVDRALTTRLPPPGEDSPETLDTPEDLAAALSESMARGEGDERAITEALRIWLAGWLSPDERRIGGQAGIMSDFLSTVGAAPVIYTYLLSDEQKAAFSEPGAVRFPVVDDGVSFVPLTAVPSDTVTKTNWIFEFRSGTRFFETTAAASTRFIGASRLEQFDLDIGPLGDRVEELATAVDCAILSGYHGLKPTYGDGTTSGDRLRDASEFVEALSSEIPVQVEYGVAHDEAVRRGIVEEIVPHADVVSVDTTELEYLAADLGIGPVADDIEARYDALGAIRARFDLSAAKLHAREYFLAVTDDYLPDAAVRDGFEFAAVVAAAKARRGSLASASDLEDGLAVEPSDGGRDQVARIEPTEDAVAVPNRVVPDPVGTVGIGDVVSCASFALEQATEQS